MIPVPQNTKEQFLKLYQHGDIQKIVDADKKNKLKRHQVKMCLRLGWAYDESILNAVKKYYKLNGK